MGRDYHTSKALISRSKGQKTSSISRRNSVQQMSFWRRVASPAPSYPRRGGHSVELWLVGEEHVATWTYFAWQYLSVSLCVTRSPHLSKYSYNYRKESHPQPSACDPTPSRTPTCYEFTKRPERTKTSTLEDLLILQGFAIFCLR